MKSKSEEEFFGRSRSHVTTSSSISSKTRFLEIITILWSIMLVLPTLPTTANAFSTTTTTPETTTTYPTTSTTHPTTTTQPTTTTTPVPETTTTFPERTTTTPTPTTTPTTTPTATTATATTTTPAPTTTTTATQFTSTTKRVSTTTATVPTTAATISNVPDPVITSFNPNFGPIAGLTKVRLTGTGFNGIQEISFGASGPGNIDINSRTDVSLTVLTPESNFTGSVNADIVLIGGGGGRGKQLNQQFIYKGNPEITGFNYSKYQLITGGSLLTVLGTNLDSVANPKINATVTIADQLKILSSESYLNDCGYNGSGVMYCPLPDLRLPQGFIQTLENNRGPRTAALTATTSASVARITGPNGTYADVYLGFILDGLRKYENITDPKAQIANPPSLSFIPPPIINSSTDVITFNGNDDKISITGEYFQVGCQESGVQCKVYVGDEMCSGVTVVTDNQMTCLPPKNRPQTTSNDTICTEAHADTYAIRIVVGFRVYQYKCLEYFYTNVPLIVGLTVGLGVPVCVLVGSLVVCLCLRCRREEKTTGRRFDGHQQRSSARGGIELDERSATGVDSESYARSIGTSIGAGNSVYPPSRHSDGYTRDIGDFGTEERSDAGNSLDEAYRAPQNDYSDSISKARLQRTTFYPPSREDETVSGDSSMGSQGKRQPGSSSYGRPDDNLGTSFSSRGGSFRSRPDSDFLRRISEHSES